MPNWQIKEERNAIICTLALDIAVVQPLSGPRRFAASSVHIIDACSPLLTLLVRAPEDMHPDTCSNPITPE